MELDTIVVGDCLDVLPGIPSGSIDMVLADPPYGITACKWDTIIPFEPMWAQLKRVTKPNGAIVLTASQPFTSALVMSNIKMFKYCWIWNKKKAANFLFGNKMPLKITEDICVFYKKQPTYNPCKIINPKGSEKPGRKGIGNTIHDHLPNCPKRSMAGKSYEADKLLPTTILEFSKPARPLHPTQKPVALFEYLINTYTNVGDTVLDFVIGSGTTAVAALKLGRHFYGCDISSEYVEMANGHIEKARLEMSQLSFLFEQKGISV